MLLCPLRQFIDCRIFQITAIDQMSVLLQRREVQYGLAIVGVSALLYGAYQLWKALTSHPLPTHHKTPIPSEPQNSDQEEDHIPYEELIHEKHYEKMTNGRIHHLPYLQDIHYRIIFCLMKGSAYQGIAIINFHLASLTDQHQYFTINYNGVGIKFLMVNHQRMDPRDVRFIDHCIQIPKQLLRENAKNHIQIIFQNSYSFLNEGLAGYFVIDENNKYSLRQQVIYALNGYLQIERIIPCINCLNQCRVVVEVIHPDTFEVFSNASKSLQRFCSVIQYQKYPFLFDHSSNSLNRSFKMNASTLSLADSNSNYSTSNFYNRKKANSHFYPTKLPSIHHLFLFSSQMVQVLPSLASHPIQEKIMIRYFCKSSQSHRIQRGINKLQGYVVQVLKKLNDDHQIEELLTKIDILMIGDRESEGTFTMGALLLYDGSLEDHWEMRYLYLIARALYGMVLLSKGHNIVTIQQILQLNQMVFKRFQQFRNFLFLANQQYGPVRDLIACTESEKKEYVEQHQGYILSYYCKEMKFIVMGNLSASLSFEFKTLMTSLKPQSSQQFWQKFLANYNFLSPLIIEPLLKLALQRLGRPQEEGLREQLKVCFNSSKYTLAFYSNKEIEDNLPKFMEYEPQGLEERLTKLKVKQKFKDFITQKYQKYLPVKSNIAQAETIYCQFKKFNQQKNFHHISLLLSQIERVQCFGESFIKPERISAQCSAAGWRLLTKLKIYPLDEDYYQLLAIIQQL